MSAVEQLADFSLTIEKAVDEALAEIGPKDLEAHERTSILERATRAYEARAIRLRVYLLRNAETRRIGDVVVALSLIDRQRGRLEVA